jgi:L-threonylcarbamoyladenylate synthase
MLPTERLLADNPAHLARAARLLREGGTVAFPTETVYGLGANALDPVAVEKIFVAKQRPHWDPLIVHISNAAMLARVAVPASATAQQLMDRFWPGPLTLLLPRAPGIPDIVTAGRALVGVRMPAHAVARQLIETAGVPIAAPSANTFGHTSPTTAAHVLADLDGRIDAVLDGGPCEVGLESTVAEVYRESKHLYGVRIYREGAVTAEDLEEVVGGGGVVRYQPEAGATREPASLPSPGVGLRHYAPRARLLLEQVQLKARTPIEFTLVDAIDRATDAVSRVGVMLPSGWNRSAADLVYPWGPWDDAGTLARRLYDGLRTLDEGGATDIICPVPSGYGIAEAIRDRLLKAAKA